MVDLEGVLPLKESDGSKLDWAASSSELFGAPKFHTDI